MKGEEFGFLATAAHTVAHMDSSALPEAEVEVKLGDRWVAVGIARA